MSFVVRSDFLIERDNLEPPALKICVNHELSTIVIRSGRLLPIGGAFRMRGEAVSDKEDPLDVTVHRSVD